MRLALRCALTLAACAETRLAIAIKDPVDFRLAADLTTASLHARSGKNRCEVMADIRDNVRLPD